MKPKYNSSTLRNAKLGASLVSAITICFAGSASADTWDGDVSSDWNDNANWPGDDGTTGNVTVNSNPLTNPPYRAIISANATQPIVDLFVGNGAGVNARMDHTAGTASTGNNNWTFIGRAGGTGVYNLTGGAAGPGTNTLQTQGTGSYAAGAAGDSGRLYIGGNNGTGSNGTMNVNTTGTLKVNSQMEIGTNSSVGVLNLDSGTINTGNAAGEDDWFEIGNGGGCTGTLNISGGSITKVGAQHFIVGANGSTGFLNMSGGSITVNNEIWVANNGGSNGTLNISAGTISNNSWAAIGRAGAALGTVNMTGGTWNKTGGGNFIVGDNSPAVLNLSGGALVTNGEFWVGQAGGGNGTINLSGSGSLTSTNWTAIGRDGGTALVTQTGGTWIKSGANSFIVGASGPGTYNQSAGLVDVQAGDTWMGENNVANYTLSGTGEFRATYFQVARNGSSTGNVNLNGGTLRANQIVGGGGIENVSFNGTQIFAKQDQANFIGGMDTAGATIDAGGLLINSAGFTLTAPQSFDGAGGVVKSGAGTLTLSGANSYTGDNTVNLGTLVINNAGTGNNIVNAGSLSIGVPGTGNSTVNAGSLLLTAAGPGTGAVSIANGAVLGVTAPTASAQLIASSVTLGTSSATTLNLNLGDVVGVNPSNSLLDVTGGLAVNGAVTVNVAGTKFAVGNLPLFSYNAASLTGAGSFALGTLPSGVVATLQVNPNYFGPNLGAYYLDITSVALPEWDGTNEVLLVKSGDTVVTSFDITVADATGIIAGQAVRGPGIPNGTTVASVLGLTVTLSQAATASATGVNFNFVTTAGTNEGVWDTTTQNWIDQVSTLSSVYADPNPVLFSDLATGPTAVTLNITVNPADVLFNNSSKVYSLSGTGAINGPTGLTKQGTAGLTLATTNTYDGVTSLQGGVTSIATIEDGGIASPIGDSSAAPANLVLAGGVLEYTGAADSTNRGFTVGGANGAIRNANGLTISGQVATSGIGSGFIKQGAGNLSFTFGGANTFGASVFAGMNVQAGGVIFDGTAGGQINTVAGELQLASVPDVPASLTVTNTTLNVASWLAAARGNGDLGVTNLTVTNSTLTTGGFSCGWDNGLANNASETFATITGSSWTNGGTVNFAESNGATGTMNLVNSTWISNSGIFNMSNGTNTTSTLTISGTSELRVDRFLIGLGTGSVANVVIEDSGSLNKTGGSWMSFGNGNNGVGNVTVRDGGSLLNAGGDFNVSDTGTSKGFLTIEDSATVSSGGNTFVGKNTGTEGGITQTGGTFNQQNGGYLIIGRFNGATGVYNISGGVLNQNDPGLAILVSEEGSGTLTVSGTAQVNANGPGLYLTTQASGTGTGVVNLNGGTITCKRVAERDNTSGTSTFHFNGGTLKAGAGVNANFMDNLNSAVIDPGGAYIDTNGQVVTIAQVFDDGGGDLHKIGTGTLRLNGASGFIGSTFVDAGTLGGTGAVGGPLIVSALASVNPGVAVGTFTADSADISGKYVCEINGATADQLAVGGALTIQPGAELDFSVLAAPTSVSSVIATFSSRTGTFTPLNVPSGFQVVYNPTSITLELIPTPYTNWATSYGLNPLTDGAPGVDKDTDGQLNGLEFALYGSPVSGSDNAKIYNLVADGSVDVSPLSELLMTIAVRAGTPVFVGSPSPTATKDGATYTIQGSTTLGSFTTGVTPVAPVTGGLPALPIDYEYRTFSLDGSNGTPTAGFLRVQVSF